MCIDNYTFSTAGMNKLKKKGLSDWVPLEYWLLIDQLSFQAFIAVVDKTMAFFSVSAPINILIFFAFSENIGIFTRG